LNQLDRHPLSFETALTPAAVTALIDRLEARGLVRRRPDTRDRRKVLVEATDKTHDLILETYAPTARAGLELLASYSLDELATIRHFLEEVLALQQRMTAVLLERGGSKH
jgi:DNA-binding MarR family transcriptional regulator